MAISFIRCDDRIIHGQIVVRWSTEFPCDGIIAVNDKAATNDVIKSALKSASNKKTFIWTYDQFLTKMEEAVKSEKNYFVITKEPITMAKLLVDNKMKVNVNTLNIGPQSAREGTFNVNKNADITKEEIQAYERIHQAGYKINFQLVPDFSKVEWKDVREKLLAL
ncbi:PTS system mannose-specific IIB component [Mobilisporobacter senegalensis]|uniref:PTS system mannose-specific IIB component n=1 Tax=Mobilisporobacter senegalensis TaxID=1329262 RepID=A0A3N1X5X7_9FIRM|nr:PTS sugar transporter subunit IIB [Mobilisporobacter senegalensis]ROR22165.1 PTS system mannose-specific IIB component [Mobilisporobacter senegalensis]